MKQKHSFLIGNLLTFSFSSLTRSYQITQAFLRKLPFSQAYCGPMFSSQSN